MITKEKLVSKLMTPKMAGMIKNSIAYPRYKRQLRRCKAGFSEFGQLYNQPTLFVAGLPKSGTTWLEKMLSSIPGFHEVMIPEAVYYEQKHIGSHDFDYPEDTFSRLANSLSVIKLHVHGSLSNQQILEKANLKYVVLFRDLRDVAVSYYFYVRNTPWHPEHKVYSQFKHVQEGLVEFSKVLLPEYKKWINSWRSASPRLCLIEQYEELRMNTSSVMKRVVDHYELNLSAAMLATIIDKNSFGNLSAGRNAGDNNSQSFFRKGISGDWKNHFNQELKTIYKNHIGDFLIKEGYEQDNDW